MKRKILCGVLALSLLTNACSKDTVDTPKNDAQNEVSITITDEILQLVNTHRQSVGLPDLIRSDIANAIADKHTEYMISKNKISHDNFAARFEELKKEVNARSAGENVAYGYATAKTVMDGWLNSSGHRANIEGNFTHIGISAIKDSEGRYYYTQLFYSL